MCIRARVRRGAAGSGPWWRPAQDNVSSGCERAPPTKAKRPADDGPRRLDLGGLAARVSPADNLDAGLARLERKRSGSRPNQAGGLLIGWLAGCLCHAGRRAQLTSSPNRPGGPTAPPARPGAQPSQGPAPQRLGSKCARFDLKTHH